jgi:hypothetical protein
MSKKSHHQEIKSGNRVSYNHAPRYIQTDLSMPVQVNSTQTIFSANVSGNLRDGLRNYIEILRVALHNIGCIVAAPAAETAESHSSPVILSKSTQLVPYIRIIRIKINCLIHEALREIRVLSSLLRRLRTQRVILPPVVPPVPSSCLVLGG